MELFTSFTELCLGRTPCLQVSCIDLRPVLSLLVGRWMRPFLEPCTHPLRHRSHSLVEPSQERTQQRDAYELYMRRNPTLEPRYSRDYPWPRETTPRPLTVPPLPLQFGRGGRPLRPTQRAIFSLEGLNLFLLRQGKEFVSCFRIHLPCRPHLTLKLS